LGGAVTSTALTTVTYLDGVAVLTLDDDPHRNSISLAMVDEIVAAMEAIEARDDVGAVVVTGAGDVFCAGADLSVLAQADPAAYQRLYEGFLRIARCPLLTVAAVNGPATGAGMNLALCCDIRLAAPQARFISRFLEIGLHPGGGHTWMLQRAVGRQLALAMVLCGEELDGERAVGAGLVLRCVPAHALMDEAVGLARSAAQVPRDLLGRAKATFSAVDGAGDHPAAVHIESTAQAWSASTPYFQQKIGALMTRVSRRQKESRTGE
jgi:enoyl-CoA hydratase